MSRPPLTLRRHKKINSYGQQVVFNLISRIIAATLGGYGLAVVTAIGLAGVLPMGRADAVMTGHLTSFGFYLLAVLWAFSTRTAMQAWTGIAVWTVVFGVVALITAGASQ